MAAEVFQDTIELTAPSIEAVPFGDRPPSCYPLPELRVSGPSRKRVFQTLILENPYLRATFLPELGGRLISLFDKRTSLECLPPENLEASEYGKRGIWIPQGIQWQIGERIRPSSMAEVDVQIIEDSEDGSGNIVFFEHVPGAELSWHLWISLPADRAQLQFVLRALNRGLERKPYQSGYSFPSASGVIESATGATCVYNSETQTGIAFAFASGAVNGVESTSDASWLHRYFHFLGPRQTDAWQFSLAPVSGLSQPDAYSEAGAVQVGDGKVLVQAHRRILKGKLFIQDRQGQTLEASVTLEPDAISEFDLGGVKPSALLIRGGNEDLLSWPMLPLEEIQARQFEGPEALPESDSGLERARRDSTLRPAANIALAHKSVVREDLEQADHYLDEALLFNGDDPLAWWLKAVLGRHRGQDEESPELPNAHYLAPMEPLLRVEAFLRQPPSASHEGNALLRPLAENPELLLECACKLLEAGLKYDAARFLEEAIRHRDVSMLRLLSAWNMLQLTHLKSEAAIQVGKADGLGIGPPYPWRNIEERALKELNDLFPESKAIAGFLQMVRFDQAGEVSLPSE